MRMLVRRRTRRRNPFSLKREVNKAFHEIYPLPSKVAQAYGDARYSLEYGPSGGGGRGFEYSVGVIREWWEKKYAGDWYYNGEYGDLTQSQTATEEEPGDWYLVPERDMLQAVFGPVGDYI